MTHPATQKTSLQKYENTTFTDIKYTSLIKQELISLHKLIEGKKCDNRLNEAAVKI